MADRNKDVAKKEAIGGGVGGVAGAATGAASNIDDTDDAYYRDRFASTSRNGDYDRARPAFQLGHIAGMNPDYENRTFDDVEPQLRAGWTDDVARQSGDWNDVRDYARDAFERGRERRLTLAEEQLAVGKRTVQAGEVAVHKKVDTRRVEQEVELVREEVSVDRRPLSADSAADIHDIGEEEIRVPVMREEAVVEKRTVPIEEVVIRKEAVADTQRVSADLRKETVDVDENVDTTRGRTGTTKTTDTTRDVDARNERR
jgi:uncharacterized protein (TIGR02271 family)